MEMYGDQWRSLTHQWQWNCAKRNLFFSGPPSRPFGGETESRLVTLKVSNTKFPQNRWMEQIFDHSWTENCVKPKCKTSTYASKWKFRLGRQPSKQTRRWSVADSEPAPGSRSGSVWPSNSCRAPRSIRRLGRSATAYGQCSPWQTVSSKRLDLAFDGRRTFSER